VTGTYLSWDIFDNKEKFRFNLIFSFSVLILSESSIVELYFEALALYYGTFQHHRHNISVDQNVDLGNNFVFRSQLCSSLARFKDVRAILLNINIS
jgi:hypothetical protein